MYPLEMPALCPAAEDLDGMEKTECSQALHTHKDTLAVAVIDHAGRVVRQLELPNQDSGYVRLLALLSSHNVVRVGVEGSGNFGWPAAIYLLERDRQTVSTASWRANGTGSTSRAAP